MGAFILAAIILAITLAGTILYIFGNAMSDTTGQNLNPWPGLIGGCAIAAIIASSHWWPHIGW